MHSTLHKRKQTMQPHTENKPTKHNNPLLSAISQMQLYWINGFEWKHNTCVNWPAGQLAMAFEAL